MRTPRTAPIHAALVLAVLASPWSTACSTETSPADVRAGAARPASLEPATVGSVPNLHAYGDVLLAGQPGEGDLAALRERGVKTVLDLRTPEEDRGFDESGRLRALGMEYVPLPFRAPETLTDEVFDRSRALLNDASKHPLLVHCASANRVGAVWLAHRVLDGGLTWDAALAEAQAVGLRTAGYEARAREYVDAAR